MNIAFDPHPIQDKHVALSSRTDAYCVDGNNTHSIHASNITTTIALSVSSRLWKIRLPLHRGISLAHCCGCALPLHSSLSERLVIWGNGI